MEFKSPPSPPAQSGDGYCPFRVIDQAGCTSRPRNLQDPEAESRESLRYHICNLDTARAVAYHESSHEARKLSNALNAAYAAFAASGGKFEKS